MTRFGEITGYAKESKTILCNHGYPVSASGFAVAANGTLTLAQNKTSSTAIYTISGLNVGAEINGFRVVGALGAAAENATVVNASIRKVTKGAGAVTDESIGAITEVSVVADTALDAEKTGLRETVSADYQYYVLVTCTTADNAACNVALAGVEVDLNKR